MYRIFQWVEDVMDVVNQFATIGLMTSGNLRKRTIGNLELVMCILGLTLQDDI